MVGPFATVQGLGEHDGNAKGEGEVWTEVWNKLHPSSTPLARQGNYKFREQGGDMFLAAGPAEAQLEKGSATKVEFGVDSVAVSKALVQDVEGGTAIIGWPPGECRDDGNAKAQFEKGSATKADFGVDAAGVGKSLVQAVMGDNAIIGWPPKEGREPMQEAKCDGGLDQTGDIKGDKNGDWVTASLAKDGNISDAKGGAVEVGARE